MTIHDWACPPPPRIQCWRRLPIEALTKRSVFFTSAPPLQFHNIELGGKGDRTCDHNNNYCEERLFRSQRTAHVQMCRVYRTLDHNNNYCEERLCRSQRTAHVQTCRVYMRGTPQLACMCDVLATTCTPQLACMCVCKTYFRSTYLPALDVSMYYMSVCLSVCLVCMYALCVHFLSCLYVACCMRWCLSFICASKEDVWIPSAAKSLVLLAMTVHAQCTLSARSVHTTVHTQCTLRFYWLFTKCEK